MLTKEECKKTYNYLFDVLSSGYDGFGIFEEVKYNPITNTRTIKPLRKRERALRVFYDLIKEHFELVEIHNKLLKMWGMEYPKPYKFDDLKIQMHVCDDKLKIKGIIVGILADKRIEYIWVDTQGYIIRERETFEENRFFPVQMANIEVE